MVNFDGEILHRVGMEFKLSRECIFNLLHEMYFWQDRKPRVANRSVSEAATEYIYNINDK